LTAGRHGVCPSRAQGFRTREGVSGSETVPLDCRAASGLSRAERRGEDGSLRSKMRESPPLRFGKPRAACWSRLARRGFCIFRASSGASRWQSERHKTAHNGTKCHQGTRRHRQHR